MDSHLLDLYTDYLISSFDQTTATGLSRLLDREISHDRITRLLASPKQEAADLWHRVKPLVRQVESDEGVLIIDDTIEEKPYTDENEIVCWHYDHAKGRTVKGMNLITALYHVRRKGASVALPVSFEVVAKTQTYTDKKTGRERRRSPTTKNERMRRMLQACMRNQIRFTYVLADVWYASAENMCYVRLDLEKHFIFPLKKNRKVALSKADKLAGRYVAVSSLELEADAVQQIHLESVPFALYLLRQVFTNEDGSQGVRYLVTSDKTLPPGRLSSIYQRRWKSDTPCQNRWDPVEEYHKSLKQNASLEKSPTRTPVTQTNHLFASLLAFVKLERLKLTTSKNHYALKAKLYVKALRSAFAELQHLKQDGFATSCVA